MSRDCRSAVISSRKAPGRRKVECYSWKSTYNPLKEPIETTDWEALADGTEPHMKRQNKAADKFVRNIWCDPSAVLILSPEYWEMIWRPKVRL